MKLWTVKQWVNLPVKQTISHQTWTNVFPRINSTKISHPFCSAEAIATPNHFWQSVENRVSQSAEGKSSPRIAPPFQIFTGKFGRGGLLPCVEREPRPLYQTVRPRYGGRSSLLCDVSLVYQPAHVRVSTGTTVSSKFSLPAGPPADFSSG